MSTSTETDGPEADGAEPAKPAKAKRRSGGKPRRRKSKRKKGKPRSTTLTHAVREAIVESVRAGASITTACVAAGTSRSNYYHWRDMGLLGRAPYKGFLTELDQARAMFETEHVKIVNNASFNGDWRAAAWLLARHPRTRKKYGEHQRIEHTGADGGPIQTSSVPLAAIEEAQAAMNANADDAASDTPDAPDQLGRVAALEAELGRLKAELAAREDGSV